MSEVNKTIVTGIAGVLFSFITLAISDYGRRQEVNVLEQENKKIDELYSKLDSLYILEVKHRKDYKFKLISIIDSLSNRNDLNVSLTSTGLNEINKEYKITKLERDSIYKQLKR